MPRASTATAAWVPHSTVEHENVQRYGGHLARATWRRPLRSQANGNCVEVADGVPGAVPVRDSKHPTGPALVVPAGAWAAFVERVKG